ncbi:Hypothetical protein BN69_1616 [Methylocystis sp. SC2]|nr:Hypothetical protein BN69_1616 [Methylocystis sp. SC2]
MRRRTTRRDPKSPRSSRSAWPEDEAHSLIDRDLAEIQKQTEREAGAADEDQRGARAQANVVGIGHDAFHQMNTPIQNANITAPQTKTPHCGSRSS